MDKPSKTQPDPLEVTPEQAIAKIPGAEIGHRIDAWWWLLVAIIAMVVFLVFVFPDPYRRIVVFVADGIVITIAVTILSFIFTLVAGLIGGLGRLSKSCAISTIATFYVEIVRGVPLLVQLLAWYFAFPVVIQGLGRWLGIDALISYQANAFAMAIIGLSFCYGAYMSEIYRAGIQSIPGGQREAALSLGMSNFQSLRYVILPQAIRVILPPIGNEFIALLKDSSWVSVVAVADLTRRGREFMSQTFDPISTWLMVALIYLIMTLFSARVVNWIEKRTEAVER